MRRILVLAAAFLLGFATKGAAQTTQAPPPAPATITILTARTGARLDTPHVGTYRYLELFQVRGKWIVPDVGYIDFYDTNYREAFVGFGRTLVEKGRTTVIEELYYDQAFGSASGNAKYLQPWTMVQFKLTDKLASETVYFPYLPLNDSARIQHVLERAKLEYSFSKMFRAGAGYGGYKYGDNKWQHKPFATATVSTKAGDIELWLQRMPEGAQAQLRYTLVHKR